MPLDVPRDISQLSAGARELAEKYKVGHKELLPEPDLEDRKKAKPAKPATEVALRENNMFQQLFFRPSNT